MTRQVNNGFRGVGNYGASFSLCIGVVKNNADPAQHGRLQVFIPSIDSKDYELEDLPWANYVSPFGGTTADFLVGREKKTVPGISSYGMWMIPKNGAQVLIGFMESDPSLRYWMGCVFLPELNRTLPQSINDIKSEIDESGIYPQKEIPHYAKNLGEAGLGVGTQHWKTRGGWQRSVSHPSNKNTGKPTTDGYYTKPLEGSKADSQSYCITTPGRHYFVMSDVDEECRIRIKTTEGSQIILDDTNERIYISTAMGRNWVEIDEGSGKIYFYTTSKLNFHAENDINLYSTENINIVAKKRINIESEERAIKLQAKMNIEALSKEANLKFTASRDIHLKNFDGPKAPEISEKMTCNPPPWSGVPLGLTRDYQEEAGSDTSNIYINAVQEIHQRSDEKTIFLTAKKNIEERALDGDYLLQAKNIKSKAEENLEENAKNITSYADMTNIVHGDLSMTAKSNLVAAVVAGTQLSLNGGASVAVTAATIGLNGITLGNVQNGALPGGPGDTATKPNVEATAAEAGEDSEALKIKPLMIVPEHEPWTRDEDEGQCKTPRNAKYQG